MIELRDITKEYPAGAAKVEALKGISLAFRSSEFVAVLGPSGGGKTTLLNIIGGLDQYTSGDLVIDGRSTREYAQRDWDSYRNHSVGFVFQSYNLIPHQTVLANVELALTLSGVGRQARREKAEKALAAVGLEDQMHKKPNQLSGGQMQRVAIARALVNDPEILLADEPTGALDSATGISVMNILKEVSARRLVVMVTHNPELAEKYADRVISLSDGLIRGDSRPYDGKAEPLRPELPARRRPSMGFLTAFSLSLNNLMTKKTRTLLTSFAGSIGIIGIALILALSNGVSGYIDKVQKDTLSAYPLMIRSTSADLSSLVTAMLEARKDQGGGTGDIVTENKIVADMFAKVGTNDLAAFKKYLEAHYAEIEPDLNSLEYLYGVAPEIYKADTSAGAVRLNPSQLKTPLASSAMAGSSSVFQQLPGNADLLASQYDLTAGRWPAAYDETVLILTSAHTISDYTEYALGLRDQSEFDDMVAAVRDGREPQVPEDTRTWTYQDFLRLSFKVVSAADYYQYNPDFKVWEDHRDDADYLKALVDKGLSLKVVGVIVPSAGSQMSSLSSGIGYTRELADHLIAEASGRPIVLEQLADPERDVFSGKSFAEESAGRTGLDMSKLISVDQTKIASAIGMDIDSAAVSSVVQGYLQEALAKITTDTAPAAQDLTSLAKGLTAALLNSRVAGGAARIPVSDITPAVSQWLAEPANQELISKTAARYSLTAAVLTPLVANLQQGFLGALATPGTAEITVPADQISALADSYFAAPATQAALGKMAGALTEAGMKAGVAAAVTGMSGELVRQTAGALKVDPAALAGAFSINLSEAELTRLMSTVSASAAKDYSSQANLTGLGYADPGEPAEIDVYLKDFSAKEDFQDFIDRYNQQMIAQGRDESQITYTDVAASVISSVKSIVDTVSYVLIAFVAVSLIVSSIMIGIITYISVLERIKEIGLLRAIGASRRDISRVFNAETFIIGLGSGILGVAITALLCLPINIVIRRLTGIPSLTAYLPWASGAAMIMISVLLTLTAGLIPSGIAARKNPIEALRTE